MCTIFVEWINLYSNYISYLPNSKTVYWCRSQGIKRNFLSFKRHILWLTTSELKVVLIWNANGWVLFIHHAKTICYDPIHSFKFRFLSHRMDWTHETYSSTDSASVQIWCGWFVAPCVNYLDEFNLCNFTNRFRARANFVVDNWIIGLFNTFIFHISSFIHYLSSLPSLLMK